MYLIAHRTLLNALRQPVRLHIAPRLLYSRSTLAIRSSSSLPSTSVKAIPDMHAANATRVSLLNRIILVLTMHYKPWNVPLEVRSVGFPFALILMSRSRITLICLFFIISFVRSHNTMNSALSRLRIALGTMTMILMLYLSDIAIKRGKEARVCALNPRICAQIAGWTGRNAVQDARGAG
jgi:hypothetical protein